MCAEDREHPGRSAAKDGDRVTRCGLSQLGSEVAGGKDVGNENHLFVGDIVRKFSEADMRVRNARELRLQTVKGSSPLRSAEEGGALPCPMGFASSHWA